MSRIIQNILSNSIQRFFIANHVLEVVRCQSGRPGESRDSLMRFVTVDLNPPTNAPNDRLGGPECRGDRLVALADAFVITMIP